MNPPTGELTPSQVVAELDRYIVGQAAAKRAVAVALRNRFRRQQLPADAREDVVPKNILMMGPTGVGKTEIARRLAQLAKAPFIKVEATKFTEVGYVGRDVESMIRDLVAASYRLIEQERMDQVLPQAQELALDRITELLEDDLLPPVLDPDYGDSVAAHAREAMGWPIVTPPQDQPDNAVSFEEREALKEKLRQEIVTGTHNAREIEYEIEEQGSNFMQVFTPQGMEEMGIDFGALNNMHGPKRAYTKTTVGEAMPVLIEQEAKRLLAGYALAKEAVERAEQLGVIFLDEIDKIGAKGGGSGPDVSREGVQRDLLPIIEGCTVATKYGPARTDHILFVAAGAFHMTKPSDLIPELQGRLPIRVELEPLVESDLKNILSQPKNALTKQYQMLLAVDGITVEFTPDGLEEIARLAWEVNQKTDNIGARRLHTMMEKLLEDELFAAPECGAKTITFDRAMVEKRLAPYAFGLDSGARINS